MGTLSWGTLSQHAFSLEKVMFWEGLFIYKERCFYLESMSSFFHCKIKFKGVHGSLFSLLCYSNWQNHLRKQGFIWTCGLRGDRPPGWQEVEAGHVVTRLFTGRKQRRQMLCSAYFLLLCHSAQVPRLWGGTAHILGAPPSSAKLLW